MNYHLFTAIRRFMYLSKTQLQQLGAYAEKLTNTFREMSETIRGSIAFSLMAVIGLFVSMPVVSNAATYTVNVSVSSSVVNQSLTQKELLANLTSQYITTVTASQYFPNTFNVKILGNNPNYQVTQTSSPFASLDDIANKLIAISSDTFAYGYYFGMLNERNTDLGIISNYLVNCSSPTYFTFASTSTWNATSCNVSLGNASMAIYQQNLSTSTPIP